MSRGHVCSAAFMECSLVDLPCCPLCWSVDPAAAAADAVAAAAAACFCRRTNTAPLCPLLRACQAALHMQRHCLNNLILRLVTLPFY